MAAPIVSANVEGRAQGPFAQLVLLFAGRIFHGGGDTTDGELDVSLGLVLSFLALPGGFYSICLFEKYSTLLLWMRGQHNFDPIAATVSDEYFFIVLSMLVTGAVAIWRWDSIFPDRRDYANLVPLPILTRVIFLANFAAILILAFVLALVVNAASAVIFPLAVSASQRSFYYLLQLAGIHALAVFLASLFSFFAVFAIVGLLMVALPYAIFRRISLYLRAALLVFLVGTLSTSFAVPSMIGRLPHTLIRFLPSVWFLGLTQLIHGTASGATASLGWLSLKALVGVTAISIATYLIGYRRCFTRIPEVMDIDHQPTRRCLSWWFALSDSTIVRTPFQRAGYRFVWQTLLRSEHHSLVVGGFFGLGVVIASQVLFDSFEAHALRAGGVPSAEALSLPLILSYCILVGLRCVFELPTELRANWVFQLSVDKDSRECLPLARKAALSCVVPWVAAIVLPVYAQVWGWGVAVLQGVVVTVWSALLAQVLFARFRKVPFTCSFPPFRDSALVIVLAYVLGFFLFVVTVSNLEHHALLNPFFAIPLLLAVPLVWYVVSRFQREVAHIDRQLIFEEHASVAFELLNLDQRS
jgi:hypothetical protein